MRRLLHHLFSFQSITIKYMIQLVGKIKSVSSLTHFQMEGKGPARESEMRWTRPDLAQSSPAILCLVPCVLLERPGVLDSAVLFSYLVAGGCQPFHKKVDSRREVKLVLKWLSLRGCDDSCATAALAEQHHGTARHGTWDFASRFSDAPPIFFCSSIVHIVWENASLKGFTTSRSPIHSLADLVIKASPNRA